MNDTFSNIEITDIEIINSLPSNPDINMMMQQLDSVMMDKFLFIGFAALVCGAWHMSKYSHEYGKITTYITGFIDMAAFAAGVAAFGFYAGYRGWL